MKKYIALLLSLLFMASFMGCNAAAEGSGGTPVSGSSMAANIVSEISEFATLEELLLHIKANTQIKKAMLAHPSEDLAVRNRSVNTDKISVYVPNNQIVEETFDAEMYEAEISGNNIYYSFTVDDMTFEKNNQEWLDSLPRNTIAQTFSADENILPEESSSMDFDPNAPVDAQDDELANFIESCGGYEEYVKQYGYTDLDLDEIKYLKTDIVIGWEFAADGQGMLNDFVANNPVDYWEDYPGYYNAPITYPGIAEPLGYMIYWTRDNYFFEASVPTEYLDAFWGNIDSLISMELVQ